MTLVLPVLGDPDEGWFRSSHLFCSDERDRDRSKQRIDESEAFPWIDQASGCCAKKIALTVVMIPDAAAIDPRIRQEWISLVDIARQCAPWRQASARLMERCGNAGIRCPDLGQTCLKDVPGAYLDLDGHGSPKGARLGAELIRSDVERQI